MASIGKLDLSTDGLSLDPEAAVKYHEKIKNNLINIGNALDDAREQYAKIANHKKTSGKWKKIATNNATKLKKLHTNLKTVSTNLTNKLYSVLMSYIVKYIAKLDKVEKESNINEPVNSATGI